MECGMMNDAQQYIIRPKVDLEGLKKTIRADRKIAQSIVAVNPKTARSELTAGLQLEDKKELQFNQRKFN